VRNKLSKFTPTAIEAAYASLSKLNENFENIEDAIENTLSRDGTAPNAMGAPLDMNHFKIQNVGDGVNPSDGVNLSQVEDLLSTIPQGGQGEQGPAGDVSKVLTRTALSNESTSANLIRYLAEAGREGIFKFVVGDFTTLVAGDTAQGVYVASATDPTGAAGAWVRQFEGSLNFEWFGAKTSRYTDVTRFDCLPIWLAVKNHLTATLRNTDMGAFGVSGTMEIRFPGEGYYFSDFMGIDHAVQLKGMNSGQASTMNTNLIFASGKPGIIVNIPSTNGNVQLIPSRSYSASGAIIDGFDVVSLGGEPVGVVTTDLLYSGIRLRNRAIIRNTRVANFRGAGICISAAVGDGSNAFHGNCNNWVVDIVRLDSNRTGGLFVSGGDANAGVARMVDASSNEVFGIFDGAFLGNTYQACHCDANGGWHTHGGIAMGGTVHRSGRHYALRAGYLHADAIAHDPATSPTYWLDLGAGGISAGFYPDWSAAPVNTIYIAGGSYGTTGSANAGTYIGCYFETNQVPPQLGTASMSMGGFFGGGQTDGGSRLQSYSMGGIQTQGPYGQAFTSTDASTQTVQFGGGIAAGWRQLAAWQSSQATSGFDPARMDSLVVEKSSNDLAYLSSGWSGTSSIGFTPDDFPTFRITSAQTARTYGATTAEAGRAVEITKLALGAGNSARLIQRANAAPTTGAHAVGEMVFFDTPTAGGKIGSVCVTAGTPGTWKSFGVIDA
jgi:hypothetical protein